MSGIRRLIKRVAARLFHSLARSLPGSQSLRPVLHRMRGVTVGKNVFIGDDVYLENEYPERICIGDNVQIALRSVLVAHLRGPGKIVIEKNSYIGPGVFILCGPSQTLTIGEGAVVGAGSVITSSVSAHTFVRAGKPKVVAKVGKPFLIQTSYEEFLANLRPPK